MKVSTLYVVCLNFDCGDQQWGDNLAAYTNKNEADAHKQSEEKKARVLPRQYQHLSSISVHETSKDSLLRRLL